MAIPSGGGSEVLKRHYLHNLDHSAAQILINGESNHIYTVLSIIFCEQDGDTDCEIYLRNQIDGSGDYIFLLEQQPIPANGTFVWSDKFVIQETDHLEAYCENSGNHVDVYISYIEQDWS